MSSNTALIWLQCYDNQLECLNVKNGNNTAFTYFNAGNNLNLTCIEVDDVNYSTTNWTFIDLQVSFSTDCGIDCSGNTTVLPCTPSDQCDYVFTMTDTAFDGWDGASVNFVQGGQIVSTQELGVDLGSMSVNIALCDNMTTEIIVTSAGVYPDEVGYTLIDANGNTVTTWSPTFFSSGDILSTFTTSCNSSVAGCTDPTACNYDDAATVDDLSCIYATASTGINTACESYTAPDGEVYTSTGNYIATIDNAAGCDSVITIDLTINPTPSNALTQNGATLTATQTVAAYQWLDCDNGNAPIVGEINQFFNPTSTGNYAVIVTVNGCSIQSDCFLVDFTGIGELNNTPKQLIKIVDVVGRETPFKPNTPLLYIYDDGTVERKVVLK